MNAILYILFSIIIISFVSVIIVSISYFKKELVKDQIRNVELLNLTKIKETNPLYNDKLKDVAKLLKVIEDVELLKKEVSILKRNDNAILGQIALLMRRHSTYSLHPEGVWSSADNFILQSENVKKNIRYTNPSLTRGETLYTQKI